MVVKSYFDHSFNLKIFEQIFKKRSFDCFKYAVSIVSNHDNDKVYALNIPGAEDKNPEIIKE